MQEEVGLRGAGTSAHIIKPDICLTIDVTIATDMPGLEKEEPEIKLGNGPVLTLADATVIGNRKLRNFVIDTAKGKNLPLQFNTMMGGGTDGGAIHKTGPGVPTVVLSIPTRYIHSHYSIFDYDDYETALQLLLSLVKGLDQKPSTVSRIRYRQTLISKLIKRVARQPQVVQTTLFSHIILCLKYFNPRKPKCSLDFLFSNCKPSR